MNPRSKPLLFALGAVVVATGVLMPRARPAEACSSPAFVGQICTFPFDFCPTGFIPARGQFLPVEGNGELFSLLGANFGGDGINTFALPDLRGRTAVGADLPPSGTPGETAGGAGTAKLIRSSSGVQVPATQLPFLGVTYCIAVQGVYPRRQ